MTMLHHKPIRDTSEASSCEVLLHAAYSPDLTPFDYNLFTSMGHALAQQRLGSYEDVKKLLDKSFAWTEKGFYRHDIHKLTERWEKCITNDETCQFNGLDWSL